MKYGIIGSEGRMGKELTGVFGANDLVLRRDIAVDDRQDAPEVIVDFSTRAVLPTTVGLCKEYGAALVIGTTALQPEDFETLRGLAEVVPVVQSFNFSIGINVMKMILKDYARYLQDWDADIVERHHNQKKDAPSGTAVLLREAVGRDVPCQSLRMGGIPGDHSVVFANDGEVLEFSHRALSRKVFAIGALKAAEYAIQTKPGFYSFEEVLLWTPGK